MGQLDLSKYRKVSVFTKEHGVVFGWTFYDVPAVYLIKIGEQFYIDSTFSPNSTICTHEYLLKKGIHPIQKMNEAFMKERTVETYILEQVDAFAIMDRRVAFYINELKPDFNEGQDCCFPYDETKFHKSDGEDVMNVTLDQRIMKRIKEIESEQKIPVDKIILASVRKMVYDYRTTNSSTLSRYGVEIVQSFLSNPLLD